MNRLTPYEHSLSEKMKDLPLPDADKAWQQMEVLLDREKNDRVAVPPPFLKGCGAGIILLFIALLAGGYLAWNNGWFKSANRKSENSSVRLTPSDNKKAYTEKDGAGNKGSSLLHEKNNQPLTAGDKPYKPEIINTPNDSDNLQPDKKDGTEGLEYTGRIKDVISSSAGKNKALQENSRDFSYSEKKLNADNKSNKKKRLSKAKSKVNILTANPSGYDYRDSINNVMKSGTEVVENYKEEAELISDIDSTEEKDSVLTIKEIPDSLIQPVKKKSKYHIGAGAGLYKGIPLNGATDIAINNNIRNNAASDYIPSLYVRLYRADKWFLQAEFRYGVPQYNKAFLYKENVKIDSLQNLSTTNYILRKTYYHQVPVSFNYFIVPGWSIGAGVVYNRFSGAVSEESIRSRHARIVNDSLVSIRLVKQNSDSSFVKNIFQWQLETQFRWKQFSVGGRFAQAFDPYIKFTDPVTNKVISKKSNAVNIFLRYEFLNTRQRSKVHQRKY